MKIFSIKNEKLNFFNRPIYCESSAEALSYIQNILMSDADRALSGLKDDLSLYYQGDIDFTTGVILPCSEYEDDGVLRYAPVYICSLREIFDSIPEDKLLVPASREVVENCLAGLSDLTIKFNELNEKFDNFANFKKKGNKK